MPESRLVAAKESEKYYPYASQFYWQRHSFWEAGQDSWTLPPAQNPDMFQALTNVEPVLSGILQRRRGYTLFSNQNPLSPFVHSYSYRNDALGLRSCVWTSKSQVLATSESGAVQIGTLFVPSNGARAPRMVLSRDFGYFADGIASDYVKWNGATVGTVVTNWGIALNNGASSANNPSTAADQGTSATNTSQGPQKVTISNNIRTLSFLGSGSNTTAFSTTNFGFSIPGTATILGIAVSTTKSVPDGTTFIIDNGVFLLKASAAVGSDHSLATSWPTNPTTNTSYGSSSDLWGTTWTPTDINGSGFGFQLGAINNDNSQSHQAEDDGVSITVYYSVPNSQSWTNPSNITGACDAASATATATTAVSSDLRGSGFGYSTITGTITGIQIVIKASTSNAAVPINLSPILVKNGSAVGTRKTSMVTSASLANITYGSSTDLWGGAWLPADLNSASFGVQFRASTASGTATISVDCITATIFTSAGPITVGAPGSGSITLLNGRTYTYAFQNSTTGHVSNIGPFSATTGPLSSKNVPLSAIPVATDPQVDSILLLATADGNDQTTLFLIGNVPNGTTTFTDNMPDSTLLTQALYLNTDIQGVIHGLANNNVPPLLNFPTKHKGRIYGAVGRALVFSKNLDEVTTANGLITSKWEEAWPATNQFDISEYAETVQGLLSDGETLWIATERHIRRLIGDSPANFQKPEIQFNETGLINQDVWKVTFYEGQPVGTIWMTPDFRVMASDFNTYTDIGTPIQDVLNGVNIAAVAGIHASYVSNGPADYYMLYLPTGSNTTPDTVAVFNLRAKKWCIWKPTDQITTSLFFFDVNGLPRWLFGATAGSLYEWTSGTFQDRIGNTPVSYSVTMQTSWLDLGDYNIRKFLNHIIPSTADQSALTIGVEGASNEIDFSSPTTIIPATTVTPAPIPTDVFVPLAATAGHNRAFRFTFISPASTIVNVLTGFSLESGVIHRY